MVGGLSIKAPSSPACMQDMAERMHASALMPSCYSLPVNLVTASRNCTLFMCPVQAPRRVGGGRGGGYGGRGGGYGYSEGRREGNR